ncbi:dihydrodipicolinate synthase family protein [Amycolatopsis saalfeldensis]|uniref:4-hydroxy-tetrahydrodipicolinate synthase n=1 Tax=Amycolatopsis saalfeldensis TaxID=394193 RepID=A0A1H8Y4C4_9PSEU|nr:dihydrodipicolinate synthase family protein [Amycolatopsis saalfeldensis]SEP46959.1 4-hydroxy-tetrahydrodipicolinate synthase [Amycolatopsis saalfeldensis]
MTGLFTGLSAFPLTPMTEQRIDEAAFTGLVARLHQSDVDSIGALGSTGSYAYLTTAERRRVAELAVQAADGTPVIIGIGALRTVEVLRHAENAQNAGASAVLLPPMSYQPLTDDEVHQLYADVTAELSVPLCVYDNPGTTHFSFSDELHGRIAALPNVASIKIPPTPADPAAARERVDRLRRLIPDTVAIGVSGDAAAAGGLLAGADLWYSVLAGVWPEPCLALARAAKRGDADEARRLSDELAAVWTLFARYGSLRVVAAIAEREGLVSAPNLPRPLLGLTGADLARVNEVLR